MLAFSISLGAFGAHALKEMVDINSQQSFETAVKYQFYSFLVLLVISLQEEFSKKKYLVWIRVFVFGVFLFSGSIYVLVLGKVAHFNNRFAGPITPIGGLCMMVGLISIALLLARNKHKQ